MGIRRAGTFRPESYNDPSLVSGNIRSGATIMDIPGSATVSDTNDATAVAGDLLATKTAYVKGVKLAGSMGNNGALNIPSTAAGQAIPAGYHNGQGRVAGWPGTVKDTADAVLDPNYLLVGYTGYDDGVKKSGAMPNRSGENVHMPGWEVTTWEGDRVFIRPPNGYYNGSTWVTAGAGSLVAGNIRSGVNILGIVGNVAPVATASGTTNTDGSGNLVVGGLGFTPRAISGANGSTNWFSYCFCPWQANPYYVGYGTLRPLSSPNYVQYGGFNLKSDYANYPINWQAWGW